MKVYSVGEEGPAEVVNAKAEKKGACRMRGALLKDAVSETLDRILAYRGRTLKAQMIRWIEFEAQRIMVEQTEMKMLPTDIRRTL